MKTINNYIAQLDEKWLVFITSFLLLASPIAYSNVLLNPSHVPRMALLSFIAVVGMLVLLFKLWQSGKKFHFHKIHIFVLVFLIWATISITWTVDYGNFAYEIIILWGLVGLFFIASYIANFKNIQFLIFISILGATYASVIALLQNYGLNPSFIIDDNSIMHSTFAFKNHFALYLDLIIPLALSLVLITENRKLRWFLVLLTGLMAGTLLELHTRGSWLTLLLWIILACFIFYLTKKHSPGTTKYLFNRKFELISVLVISCFIFLSHGLIDEKWDRPVPEGEVLDTSSKDRLLMYYNSLGMIKDKPLTGVGYGAFWKGFREYMNHPLLIKRSDTGNYVYRLHNDPLQFFTELGLPGGFLVLTIFFFIIYMGYRLYTVYQDPTHKILILGLLMSVLACGIHSLIDFPLHKPSSAIQFWIGLGLISGLYVKQHFKPVMTNKLYVVLAMFITLLYSSVATAFHIKNIKGNYYHRQALLSGSCKKATRLMDKSISEGGFYLISHAYRVSIHIKCQTPTPQLLSILNEELAWDHTNIKALYYRGQILLQSGYPLSALRDFNKIIDILPHRSPAKIGVVSALLDLNRDEEAKTLLHKIIEEHPELEKAKTLLEQID